MILSKVAKIRFIFSLIIVLAIIVSGFLAYFKFYVKTPQYTIKAISQSISSHDLEKFHKYVDEDSLLNSLSDDVILGIIALQENVPDDAKAAMTNFANMFKAPLVASLQNGINTYVETGKWTTDADVKDSSGAMINSDYVLSQIGITQITDAKLDSIEESSDSKIAVAEFSITQTELVEPFVLKIQLEEQNDGYWRVTKIVNFADFVKALKRARMKELKSYLDSVNSNFLEEQKNLVDSEAKFNLDLRSGSLGNQDFRNKLKSQIDSIIIPNLQKLQSQLEAMKVPTVAKSLHNLRISIYKHKISYYEDYSKWLEDKNIKNLREATENLQMAQTLENDASLLSKRMETQVADINN